jgi:glutamate racemase
VNSKPIAVFDSGLGGLSVVRHLRQFLPSEDIVYFGDTARVPYGTKTRATVANFALDDATFLLQFEPKLVVVACNTASALAMPEITRAMPVPVIGVVEPGARTAAEIAGEGTLVVLGTEATVNSGAYPAAIAACGVNSRVIQKACPLFVPLVEEGRDAGDPIVRMTVESYLSPLKTEPIRAIVLGCTHYPLLRDAIAAVMGSAVHIVDSGREASLAVQRQLQSSGALAADGRAGTMKCYVSDNPTRFREVGSRFLNQTIEHVEFVDPERYIR